MCMLFDVHLKFDPWCCQYMGLVSHAVLELIHEVVEHVLVFVLVEAWGVLALGLWGDRPTCQLGI